jgi:hypothetical protein
MSLPADLSRLSISQLAQQFAPESVPLGSHFSYFAVALPLGEEEMKDYLIDPVSALPPAFTSILPRVLVLLVPYLERANGKPGAAGQDLMTIEAPPDNRWLDFARIVWREQEVLALAVRDQEMADYHYHFYRALAELASERLGLDTESQYFSVLREELNSRVHGEVDEQSWHLKQALLRRQTKVRRETKPFRAYARQSLVDTLTLYLHGICCDIDVETGPRQLPSRHLRKRLLLLQSLFPPPEGFAVFPEDLKE